VGDSCLKETADLLRGDTTKAELCRSNASELSVRAVSGDDVRDVEFHIIYK